MTKAGGWMTSGNTISGSLFLPEHPNDGINDYTLTTIVNFGFYNCSELTSIEFPKTINEIQAWAFYECSNLRSVEIPEQVIVIEGKTFAGCSNLESVTFPKNLTEIRSEAFFGCSKLTSIDLPSTLTYIDCFGFCTGLKSVILPRSIETIGSECFYGCTLKPLRINRAFDHSKSHYIILESGSVIECMMSDLHHIESREGVTIRAWNQYAYNVTPCITGAIFTPVVNPDYDRSIIFTKTELVITGGEEPLVMEIKPNDKTLVSELKSGHYKYQMISYDSEGTEYIIQEGSFTTTPFTFNVEATAFQTYINVSEISCPTDETFKISEIGVKLSDEDKQYPYFGHDIKISNLQLAKSIL